jgi:hypothetical protein
MTVNIKFYKIKLLEKFLQDTAAERTQLLNELKTSATDSDIVDQRYAILKHLSMYEMQIIEKIQNFDTDDIDDLTDRYFFLNHVTNRDA